ncbi:MAG TPA: D-Ala-D-Ala carboxypeptidase family metallohydrolase [Rubrivivax sp.]|nr:D-Ala-D-Ala carboxypeptidase family metallohydrolase [Rubrivivax sp.]
MTLSRFFTLAEMTHSDTAVREGIANRPGAAEADALRALCTAVLDPLREAVGRPIKVNSGYRGPALNRRIGGAPNSQHARGLAADIQSPGTAVLELFKRVIQLGLPFDQLIYEARNASTKWVHVSHNPGANRGEIRVAEFAPNGRPTGYPRVTVEQALLMSESVTRSARGTAEPGYVETNDEPLQDLPAARRQCPAPATPSRTGRKKAPAAGPGSSKAQEAPAPSKTSRAEAAGAKAAAGKAKAGTAAKPVAKQAAAKQAVVKKAVAKSTAAGQAATGKTPARQRPAKGAVPAPAGAKRARATGGKVAPAAATAPRVTRAARRGG